MVEHLVYTEKAEVRFFHGPFTMFIDVHSHLDLCKNIDKIIENAKKNKVKIVTYGTDINSNRKTLELKEKYPEIEIALGIYPIDVLKLSEKEIDSEIQFIKKNKSKISAIGEIGIDFKHAKKDTLEKQKRVLGKFIMLAKELNVPAVIHSRDAEKETIEFLENLDHNKIVMHCFGGNMNLVKKIIKNQWKLSIPANVKYSEHFQKIIEITPFENLLCETDSPYLHPDRKFPNDSTNVIESYKKISEIKKMPLQEVEKKIQDNYNRFFKS